MKKVFSTVLALVLLFSLLTASASIFDPNAKKMYVKTGDGKGLHLRTDTNTHSQILATIPYGAEVLHYSDFISMEWAHVQYGMYNGYVMNKFLVEKKPKPFVTPSPKPTVKPTPVPSPEEQRAAEVMAAQKLGIVPKGMKTDGSCTWDDLNTLLTNVIRLKTKNASAARANMYMTREEYQASQAGAQYDVVLRGVAAAELYGALIDLGVKEPEANHINDPFIADAADVQLTQEYAGKMSPYNAGDWRTKDLLSIIITVLDYADVISGKGVMTLDDYHMFYPTHPLTQEDAILAAYRLYNSATTFVGTVKVVHNRDVNLREKPSMSAKILGTTSPGTTYPVLEVEKGWYKIQLPDGRACYISAGMVAFHQQ